MNAEQFHDILSRLPEDLVAEADAKRRSKPRAIPFRRFAAMAACFAAVLAVSLFARNAVRPKGTAQTEALSAPAADSAFMEEAAAAPLAPAGGSNPERGEKPEASMEKPADLSGAANTAGAMVPAMPLDFAVGLLRNTASAEENTLVSPLSVVSALGMTMNGADGRTLEQMEQTLALPAEGLNAWISDYLREDPQLKPANSLWIRGDGSLTVEEAFRETNSAFYRADIFETAFDDAALEAINGWVAEKTDGMIPKLLSQLPADAVMYLINALAFEAEWETPYPAHKVMESTFTNHSGEAQPVTMMNATEGLYLEDQNAVGFVKYYADRRYAFAAVLPNEGISLDDYLSNLTGSALQQLLDHRTDATVRTSLPKFSLEYERELSQTLKAMGMTDAFDAAAADFTRLGHSSFGNLYISQVRHKTAITVAEEGTKAAAATSVEMVMGAAMPPPDLKIVTLDRPFLYMILDCENNYPVFLGTVTDLPDNPPSA